MEETRLADGLTDHLQRSAQGSLILVIGQVTSTIVRATALNLGVWPSLMIGGVLFVLLYLSLILGFRTLTLYDIQDLKRILGTMGPLTPVFNFFLTFFERTLKK